MGIVRGDPLTQCKNTRLQSVSTLFFLNDAHRFAPNHLGRRQIGFAQPETDAARLRAIRDLSDHALFDSAQEGWWLELFQRNKSSSCVAASVFSSRYFTITGA